MKTQLLSVTLLTLPAFATISSSSATDAFAAELNKTGNKIQVDSLGLAHITTSFSLVEGGDPNAPDIAHVINEITAGDPDPEDSSVDEVLVWEDAETGDQTFSAIVHFSDGAPIGVAYTIVTTWYDADFVLLGTETDEVVVQGRGKAPVLLEVLNPPTEAGDVVLVRGDLVQVDVSVLCDFPWLAADCEQQKAATSKKDRIQLMTSSGEIIAKTNRGPKLDNTVLLKAKELAAEPLVVAYLDKDSGTVTDTSATTITVVADPTTALLKAQVAALQAQVAALQTQLDDHEQVTENIWSTFQSSLQTNSGGIAANTASISALGTDVAANTGGIAANFGSGLDLDARLDLREAYVHVQDGRIQTNSGGIAANTASISALGTDVAANTGGIAANFGSGLDLDARLDLREAYVHVQDGRIQTNLEDIAANNAAIIRDQAVRLVVGEPARMTFAHAEFSLIGTPIGGEDGTDLGYRYLTDARIIDLTGDAADSPYQVEVSLTGNVPGIEFEAGTTLTLPNVTSAPAGATVELFGLNPNTGVFESIGFGNVVDQGALLECVTGSLYTGF